MPESIAISADYFLRYAAVSRSVGYFLNDSLATLRVHGNNSWTLNPKSLAKKAGIFVLTGYWLREKQPQLRRMANKMCGMGAGMGWGGNAFIPESAQQTFVEYVAGATAFEKAEIYLRASYHWLKTMNQRG